MTECHSSFMNAKINMFSGVHANDFLNAASSDFRAAVKKNRRFFNYQDRNLHYYFQYHIDIESVPLRVEVTSRWCS